MLMGSSTPTGFLLPTVQEDESHMDNQPDAYFLG
jgi:hypothetical protein